MFAIKVEDLEIGKQYQYNEKYYACADVTIIGEDPRYQDDDEWIGVRVRVDRVLFGKDSLEVGEEFNTGYRKGHEHYNSVKFKDVGSLPDYYHPELEELEGEDAEKYKLI